jgi:serine protease
MARRDSMPAKPRTHRAARAALVLAPLLALGACDQITALLNKFGGPQTGAPRLADVAPEFRSVAGKVKPGDEMPELKVVAAEFVAGEILLGAKVDDQVRSAASALGIPLAKGLTADAILDLDPRVEIAAIKGAVDEARRDVRTVLTRLRIDGAEVKSDPATGIMKIDLRGGAGRLRYQTTAADAKAAAETGAVPAAAGAPAPGPAVDDGLATIADTGQTCPRNITPAQIDADLTLATICTYQRLRDSGQFEFVEKNYVVEVERMEWVFPQKTPAPTPPAGQPGAPAPKPGTAPAPGPGMTPEQVATGQLPNDPLLGLQWHYRAVGTAAGQSPGGAGFEAYWQNAKVVGSRDVRVAVIDTGIQTSHPDVKGNPNILPGIDLITEVGRANDSDGVDRDANDPGDACREGARNSWHGTHVAGTIGAAMTNDQKGVASGAWNVSVVPVRALGKCGGELEDIINAIRWAAGLSAAVTERGDQIINTTPADVINMSLSVPIPCPASMQSAIDDAVARGSVIVVAAGNKANPAKFFAPANCKNVVVVGAGDARGNLAFYSNFGPEIDIIAPGGDVFADVDNDGRPDGVLSILSSSDDCFDPETKQAAAVCNYGYLQGTSMAAPHVAAALALLQAQFKVKGAVLEQTLFTRAVSPLDPATSCSVQCARNPNATTRIPGSPDMCLRECSRGRLDLGRIAGASAAGG